MSNAPTLTGVENASPSHAYQMRPARNVYSSASQTSSLSAHSTVHAFCETEQTASVFNHAAFDRRFARVSVSIDMGGLTAACAHFANNPTPNVIVVESLGDGGSILTGLEQLADVCDAGTRVIVLGKINDVPFYRALLRRHVSDYFVSPIAPPVLINSISRIIAGMTDTQTGRIAAFIGAKGGCGSSMVCHNTAWAIAESFENETVIADFDLAFGTLGLDFNQDSARGIGDALTAAGRLDTAMIEKLLSKCSSKLSLLPPPCVLDHDLTVTPEAAMQVVEMLGQSSQFVALDMPRHWNAWTQHLISQADDIVITAEPDLASLRNAKNLIDTLHAYRPASNPPVLVLNKLNTPRRPEIATKDFVNAVDLSPTALIDFDAPLFGTASNNGLMIAEVSAQAKVTASFRELAAILTDNAARPAQKSEGLLAPLLDKISRRIAG
ncbi:MAG: cellulose synthase operon protein YhjQ/BcsQ [Alphaproteobacteria bacterium]